ncbi:COP9 signalosome subunit 6 (CsnF) [Pochonia chlamydosporia 170]|uniref:COP9 signalosome complex subunit 6 n=1 Tax=Pochonia chlamydosporia 170 TaxID=1380566 RepID=A0A179F2I5_METCM|nr:COP9 signalosome subunit 6 (CsnF) [Pochonia chlamydosporia 170]OAQ59646.1 COP9 signalosome subunit 6 (CsnF) [Pochonia chlamydosporia 170]
MSAKPSNPLISSQNSSQLQAVLHPLVLLTISDYITRHTLRQQTGPVIGGLLGQQNGREITIEHAFECHTREAPEVDGGYLLDASKFGARLEQMVTVHKERQLDFVGWYTLLPGTGPTPTILPIHSQILEGWNESAVVLGFHPEEVLNHTVGGKLPLTIYESNYEVDDQKPTEQDGEDKKMDDGEATLKLKFREVPYSVETDETEMISMNYVAEGGGNATAASAPTPAARDEKPTRSIESKGKGKRRLVEAQGEDNEPLDESGVSYLSREEAEMVASLTTKANAIKMLHSRIRLLTTYLERLPPSYISGEKADVETMDTDHTTPSLPILRQIQALVNRLGLVIPSDQESFDREMLQESNNANLIGLLNSVMQSVHGARDVGKKFYVVEMTKAMGRRGAAGDFLASPGFNMPGAGDILI